MHVTPLAGRCVFRLRGRDPARQCNKKVSLGPILAPSISFQKKIYLLPRRLHSIFEGVSKPNDGGPRLHNGLQLGENEVIPTTQNAPGMAPNGCG